MSILFVLFFFANYLRTRVSIPKGRGMWEKGYKICPFTLFSLDMSSRTLLYHVGLPSFWDPILVMLQSKGKLKLNHKHSHCHDFHLMPSSLNNWVANSVELPVKNYRIFPGFHFHHPINRITFIHSISKFLQYPGIHFNWPRELNSFRLISIPDHISISLKFQSCPFFQHSIAD